MSRLLVIDSLVAGYRAPVLGPVSLTVGDGEAVGLWGPNGSGKSTLLRAVIGAARVLSGRIERPPEQRIGYQRQHPIWPRGVPLTAGEYLRYTEARTDNLPRRLRPLLSLRTDRLSGGQFQLLAVWSVLSGPARLVLLDEPTNNLDPEGVEALRELIDARTNQQGLLIVSHERSLLERCCSRLVEVG